MLAVVVNKWLYFYQILVFTSCHFQDIAVQSGKFSYPFSNVVFRTFYKNQQPACKYRQLHLRHKIGEMDWYWPQALSAQKSSKVFL